MSELLPDSGGVIVGTKDGRYIRILLMETLNILMIYRYQIFHKNEKACQQILLAGFHLYIFYDC